MSKNQINESTEKLADAFTKAFSFENNQFTLTDGAKVIQENAPEILTPEVMAAAGEYRLDVVAGMALALQKAGLEKFKADSELKEVSANANFFGDDVTVRIKRDATYRNPQDEDNPVTKYGILSVNYTATGVESAKTGRLGLINKLTQEAYTAALAN